MLLATALLLLAPAQTGPPGVVNGRVVDGAGEHYVVFRDAAGGVSYRWARRAPGTEAVLPVQGGKYVEVARSLAAHAAEVNGEPPPEVLDPVVRPGDAVLREGRLSVEASRALVARSGCGFACLETSSYDARVVLVGRTGGPWEHDLAELWSFERPEWPEGPFPNALRCPPTFEPIVVPSWLGEWWIDEAREELVVAVGPGGGTAAGRLAAISFDSGHVREGGPQELGLGLIQGEVAALRVALLRDTASVLDWLTARVEDARETRPFRVRAATALALLGRNQGVQALRRLHEQGERNLLADTALPFLTRVVDANVRGVWTTLESLGPVAVPVCEHVLAHPELGIAGAPAAARLLGEHGTREHVPALLAAVRSDDRALASVALEAAWKLAGDEPDPELLHLLEEGGAHDDVLALHFLAHRVPGSEPALRAALARHPEGTREHDLLQRALAFQTAE